MKLVDVEDPIVLDNDDEDDCNFLDMLKNLHVRCQSCGVVFSKDGDNTGGLGEICKCGWEQDILESDGYSAANHCTVNEWRKGKGLPHNSDMPDMIGVCANAIAFGAEVPEIIQILKDNGLNDYQVWLTYKAAQILIKEDNG